MTCSSLYTPRDARHIWVFNSWLAAGVFCFLAATYLLTKKEPIAPIAVSYALTAATVGLLMMAARAYVIFLRDADELLRKIQLDALAYSFGAAVIFMFGWRLCERLGAPKLDVDDPVFVMMVVWGVAQWLGYRRYAVGGEA
jgi:hypothetical protein